MKPLTLNLSRFHKVSDDGDTSTFRHHEDGHTITIAHKGLPRSMRADLKALPVYDDNSVQQPPHASGAAAQYAKGGMTKAPKKDKARDEMHAALKKRYAEGGDVESGSSDEASSSSSPQHAPVTINIGSPAPLPQNLINPEAGQHNNLINSQPKQMSPAEMSAANPGEQPYGTPEGYDEQTRNPAQVPGQDSAQAPALASLSPNAMPQQGPSQDDAQALAQALAQAPQAQMPTIMGGYNQELEGRKQLAGAIGALGEKNALIQNEKQKSLATFEESYNGVRDRLLREINSLGAEVKAGKVDPSRYWDNHSKFMTGLGLIIGGFNPSNSPNGAMEFLNNQIDRDLQAQAKNLESKNTLLSHYMQMFNSLPAAFSMSKAVMLDQAAAKLDEAAARAQSPMAAAQLKIEAGKLQSEKATTLQPLALQQSMFEMMRKNQDPSEVLPLLQQIDPKRAESIEEHHIPGVGRTDIKIPPEVRKEMIAKQNLLEQARNLKELIVKNSIGGKLNPAMRDYIETRSAELSTNYSQAVGAGENEGAYAKIKHIFGSPNSFVQFVLGNPKVNAVEDVMQENLGNLYKGYHVHPYQSAQNGGGGGSRPSSLQSIKSAPIGTVINGRVKTQHGWVAQ